MKIKKYLSSFAFGAAILIAGTAGAETLTVASVSAAAGDTGVSVPITIDIPGNTAGASFTITNACPSVLTLTDVTSTFFDTFTNQNAEHGTSLPADVEVDGTTYDQPLIHNTTGTGDVLIAGARISDGATGNTMFTLEYTVASGASAQTCAIGITASIITNAAAGYSTPTAIPMLIGYEEGPPATYPEITPTIVPGVLTVTTGITDTDNDGIDDAWEITQFGNLTTATATSDYDKDGYTDKVESQNGTNPKIADADGGPGYNGLTDKDWTMLDDLKPENIVPFRDGVAVDFGDGEGMYYYDGTAWTQLHTLSPGAMVQADVDADGIMELAAYFPSYGVYIWDGSWSGSAITLHQPEDMIAFGNGLAIDFGTYGLYTYNTTAGFVQIHTLDPDNLTSADVDNDGTMELAVYFAGHGIYIYDGTWGSAVTAIQPENVIEFGNGLALDFGATYGLYTYNTTAGFVQIHTLDPANLTSADVDADGTMELVTYFSGYGIYVYDGSWGTAIHASQPEDITRFGDGIAVDFGSANGLHSYSAGAGMTQLTTNNSAQMVANGNTLYSSFHSMGLFSYSNAVGASTVPDSLLLNFTTGGLNTYNTANGMSVINPISSALSVAADIDSDGVDEILAYFNGYGIYAYDNGSWGPVITTIQPEAMIRFGDAVALDFGSYGLYTYNSTIGFVQIHALDPANLTSADVDADGSMELAVYFAGYGIYIYDGSWGSAVTAIQPEHMIAFGNSLAIDFGSYGLYTYDTTAGFVQIHNLNPANLTSADVDSDGSMELAVYFSGYGIYVYDGSWGSAVTAIQPENVIEFGNGLALDFGAAYGLYTYNTTSGFVQIHTLDSANLTSADIDSDGTMELAVYFASYGVYIWNGSWGSAITPIQPTDISAFNAIK